jgi:hypothetical protein
MQPRLTDADAEVLTLAVMQALLGYSSERRYRVSAGRKARVTP